MGKSMPLQCKSCQNVPRPSVKFERLLIGYISTCKDRLSISILASISQPYSKVKLLLVKLIQISVIISGRFCSFFYLILSFMSRLGVDDSAIGSDIAMFFFYFAC